MLKTKSSWLALGLLLPLLTACVTVTSAPAGAYVSGAQTVTLGREWSDISKIQVGAPKSVKLLSIDGPLLNRLYVADGLADGGFLVKPEAKEKPTPTWKKDMTPTEQVEFLTDSVAALTYQRVQTSSLRPVKVGGVDGLRVDISAQTAEGLNMSGRAQIVQVKDKLFVILFLAPAEHYFAAQEREVDSIMDSARISG